MARRIALPFAAKTASELASQLGVSKKRQKRIFAIVEKQQTKSSASGMFATSSKKRTAHTARKAGASTKLSFVPEILHLIDVGEVCA